MSTTCPQPRTKAQATTANGIAVTAEQQCCWHTLLESVYNQGIQLNDTNLKGSTTASMRPVHGVAAKHIMVLRHVIAGLPTQLAPPPVVLAPPPAPHTEALVPVLAMNPSTHMLPLQMGM